jgi:hypothetical protein
VAVGVPLITPDVVLILNPEGKPVAVKLVGLFVAVIVTLYAVLNVAPGNDVLLITGVGCTGLITMLNVLIAPAPAPLDARRPTENVPEAVGVPLITPDVALILNPAGSPVAVKLVGLLVAVIVTLYAELTVPPGSDVLLITGVGCAGLINKLSVFTGLVPTLFVAVRFTLNVPVAVGVPLIAPVVVLTLNPAGNPVAP